MQACQGGIHRPDDSSTCKYLEPCGSAGYGQGDRDMTSMLEAPQPNSVHLQVRNDFHPKSACFTTVEKLHDKITLTIGA